tara:strand:- start:1413 stop:2216 length:804 start_codon:yes stop_codon:yes gene_type:complete
MMNKNNILITDTVTKLEKEAKKNVVIAGSHGGIYAGYEAAKARVRGIILHDAAVGLDRAGIGSLKYLEKLGIAAATIDYRSAIIGNGNSLANDGIISFVNNIAYEAGCFPGQKAMACAITMQKSPYTTKDIPIYEEARFLIREDSKGVIVRGCDSVSLVKAEDENVIVITASHGEVLASSPTWGKRPKVMAAIFNDAGSELVTRLPDLNKLGIPAATVTSNSARIGDARSSYDDGIISYCNKKASQMGITPDMTTVEFVNMIISKVS